MFGFYSTNSKREIEREIDAGWYKNRGMGRWDCSDFTSTIEERIEERRGSLAFLGRKETEKSCVCGERPVFCLYVLTKIVVVK